MVLDLWNQLNNQPQHITHQLITRHALRITHYALRITRYASRITQVRAIELRSLAWMDKSIGKRSFKKRFTKSFKVRGSKRISHVHNASKTFNLWQNEKH